ncbi:MULTISPECIES: TetR/AcrR family transcriptional regulator [unclassified Oleiphilus]|jgi:AcrR family transcriptional regulator|uniref:TetR/AcrR family transcriptional regulator n=2 Tax=Oleiphilus TaxID=141450 RepID=UPI0007C26E1F|nr:MULTISPECIES: TetR/AcrR family transcriptional regulator [unclassified Oleiphilus]KZY47857.1 TetR family transcriptional regulator [Oleiphilus sp. HI0050]KZY77685.1 TetR family transcriptional regulator [Oleiphilus sp. HI0069]KZY84053.1 TetR family transcriptional regulator [Oleiphilus sp. HI0068]KZY88169.1 TetR family transcriptional regulator [Oleiphilus sp. HI0072]KZZ19111.1 TetR family transcriptional regulator [Oleiphilus sp. HI0078]KZZ38936.1 TetR family transcriptional regulator [Ol
MKTKEKIVLAALELFNERGERNVSTNHIAAHLGMSPGNLYYHFRNKSDIIYEIFKNYELLVDSYLNVPSGRAIHINDLITYLDAVFNGLWAYRFLHRDLEHLLDSDERLREDYRRFTLRCLSGIQSIIYAMEKSEIYQPMEDQQRKSKALNTWLIVTNWMTYLKTIQSAEDEAQALNQKSIQHGVYQILDYVIPYLYEDKRALALELQENYRFEGIAPKV